MRILITGKPNWFQKDSHTAISFYRIAYPLKELARRTPGLEIVESVSGTMPDLAGVDCVFLHTPTTHDAIECIVNAAVSGKAIWLDFDDLVFSDYIPRANVAWTFFNAQANKKAIAIAVQSANVISVSTQVIKEKLIEHFNVHESKIHVIPNALPDEVWARRSEFIPVVRKARRILWRGSVTHNGDLLLYRSAWKPLKNIQYGFFGSLPYMLEEKYGGYLKPSDYGFQQWNNQGIFSYFETLKDMQPHYIVVPLEVCDFNRAKSNIAWLEGTLAGAACISQEDMPEFSKVPTIEFKNARGLENIFKAISKGEDYRTEAYIESRAVIETNYLLSITNKQRYDIINSL